MKSIIELRTSPHIRKPHSVEKIMRNVVGALLPLCAFAVYAFGLSALALILVVTISCLLTEFIFSRLSGKGNTLGDWSAAITGLLLALTLPPGFPLWMGFVAGFIAIALGKALFGGLGLNVFNPALVGRAFVQVSFPAAATTWTPAFSVDRFSTFIPTTFTLPLMSPPDIALWTEKASVGLTHDAYSGATALAKMKFENVNTDSLDLFLGFHHGSLGETSAALIFVCGLYLIFRRMMDWRIPAAILIGAFVLTEALTLFGSTVPGSFMLFSGGLMLGAMFMATDMVGSPVTPVGIWLYGFLIALITVVIRLYGGQTEGVMYAILFANAAGPLIEELTQPRIFGAGSSVVDKNE